MTNKYMTLKNKVKHLQNDLNDVITELYSYINEEEAKIKKGWWDPFLEYYRNNEGLSIKYQKRSTANCIKVNKSQCCTDFRPLMEYVLKFESGGFWMNEHGLFFVTAGMGSDDKATYESAREFLKKFF